jgi:hypothetical protein
MDNNNNGNSPLKQQWQIPDWMGGQQPGAGGGGAGFMDKLKGFGTNIAAGATGGGGGRWGMGDIASKVAGGGGGGPLGALSGFMENAAGPLGIGLSLASSVIGFRKARKEQRKAEKQAKASERERQRQEEAYRNLDTSNPYLNMENTMEDLTINQKQSQFQKEQFQQSQSNILDSLRGAAGGSGVAALAQQMAQSGQLASQQSAADIGRQEADNQMRERQMASQIQGMEREGDVWSRGKVEEKTTNLFGMAQQRAAADQEAVAQAKQAKMDAITGGITGAADMFAGFGE